MRLPWSGLILVVALGMALRLALGVALEVTPSSDTAWYYNRAIELLATGRYTEDGIPTAYWPVGYPAFLTALMAVFGPGVLVGKLANVLLSGLCLVLLYVWCRQRWPDAPWVARLAVALLALYPNQIGYSAALYSEPLFTALLLGICVLARPCGGWLSVLLVGVLAGAATLVKAQTLLLAPPLMALLWWSGWSRQALLPALLRTVVGVVMMAAVVAPWTWRNHTVLGVAVPVSTNGGLSLLAGNNPSMTTDLRSEFADDDPLITAVKFSVADQAAADKRARAAAAAWIAENPGRFVALMPKKLARLWLWDGESEWMFQRGYAAYEAQRQLFRGARLLNQAYYLAMLGLFVWAARGWWPPASPRALVVPALVAYFTLLSLVFSGQSRYHAPLMPFVAAGAAWALSQGLRQRRAP
jgi:hypothetical protein